MTKQIDVTAGPYKGQRLTVDDAQAAEAIAEGWADDAYPAEPAQPKKEMTAEEREKMLAAAEKGARKLRGEPEPPAAAEAAPESEPQKKTMQPEGGAPYQTKQQPSKK